MASSRTGYLAVKKESTVAVPVKPTNFLPFKDGQIQYNQEIIENNPIKGTRWNALQSVKWKVTTDGTYNFDLDASSVGYLLLIALGGYSKSTLVSGVIEHVFTVANSLPSLSLEQLKGNPSGNDYEVSRAFGVMLDSLEISASDWIVNISPAVKAHGIFLKSDLEADATAGAAVVQSVDKTEGLVVGDSVKITDKDTPATEDITVSAVSDDTITSDITNSYAASDEVKYELNPQTPNYLCENTVFTFSNVSFQFGTDLAAAGSAAEENVENWSFTYNNQLEERFWSLRDTPSKIAPKGAGGMVKYTKFFETLEDRDRYLNQERQACIITLDLGKKIGATIYNYKIEILLNDLRFSVHNIEVWTDELLISEIEAPIFYNCTDGKAIEIKVTNAVADYEA